MKKLLLVFLLAIPTLVKSQDTIRIPYPVAKQITKDLISGDSAKAELATCTEHVTLLEQKVSLKDSIIAGHAQKGILYEERIKNEQLKFDTQKLYVGELEKKNKKLRVKLLFTRVSLGAIIAGIGYLYIVK